MRYPLIAALALLALLAGGALLYLWPAGPPAHRVFVNGQVLSMDEESRIFEALSVRGALVDRLGTTEEILELVSRQTRVTDLRGRTLLPGFVDAHGHFPGSGLGLVAVDLASPPAGQITSIGGLQAALRARLADESAGDWLFGFGYDDTLLKEMRHPTREELDSVSTRHPIYVSHISGHMGVGNSRALEALGIDADSEDPEGGVIARQSGSREPTGLLEEAAHMPAARRGLALSLLDGLAVLRFASDEYVSRGVTTAQSGAVDAGLARGLARASRLNFVAPRLVLFGAYQELGERWLSGEFAPGSLETDKLAMPAIKIVADGSIQGYTGYLREPYHVPPKGGEEDYRGYPAMPRERLFEVVERIHAEGIQLAIHGNGDAAIDDILEAFAAAQAKHPHEDPRLILIHAQMARDDQLQRMLELGVTPSFFSAHTFYWGDRHRDIFMGPRRADRMSPTGSAERLGLRYTVHLDTPVAPMLPLHLLWCTVNRATRDGEVLGPEQRVSPMSALRAMTIDAAWQVFQEDRIGSLEPGKLADLAILSGDPLTDMEKARKLRVVETVIGGVSVYRAP